MSYILFSFNYTYTRSHTHTQTLQDRHYIQMYRNTNADVQLYLCVFECVSFVFIKYMDHRTYTVLLSIILKNYTHIRVITLCECLQISIRTSYIRIQRKRFSHVYIHAKMHGELLIYTLLICEIWNIWSWKYDIYENTQRHPKNIYRIIICASVYANQFFFWLFLCLCKRILMGMCIQCVYLCGCINYIAIQDQINENILQNERK